MGFAGHKLHFPKVQRNRTMTEPISCNGEYFKLFAIQVLGVELRTQLKDVFISKDLDAKVYQIESHGKSFGMNMDKVREIIKEENDKCTFVLHDPEK